MSKKPKEQIVESGYVIVDTESKVIMKNTLRSSRLAAWLTIESIGWTREKLKGAGYRCVKATITTEGI